MRRVTPEDLTPNGWLCEGCGREFTVGDEVFGTLLAVSAQTPRDWEATMTPEQRSDVENWDAPIPVEGDYRCRACWEHGTLALQETQRPEEQA